MFHHQYKKVICLGALLAFSNQSLGRSLKQLSDYEREQYITQSHVWDATDTANKDLLNGPQEAGFPFGATVSCDFVAEAMSGTQPKFRCRLPDG